MSGYPAAKEDENQERLVDLVTDHQVTLIGAPLVEGSGSLPHLEWVPET